MLTRLRRYHVLAWILTIFLLLVSHARAEAPPNSLNILILHPDSPPAQSAAQALSSKIPNSFITTTYSQGQSDLVITVGGSTYKNYHSKIQEPVLATYIFYNDFVRELSDKDTNKHALVIEPSPKELAARIKYQFDDDPIGYIYTKELDPYRDALNKHLNIRAYRYNSNLKKTFTGIYRDAAIRGFYISENREIFDYPSVKESLKSLYNNRIPAITSNEYLRKSGAVISVYSPRKDTTQAIAELAKRLLGGQPTNQLNFVPSLTEYNKTSARSLNITIRKEAEL